MEKIGPMSRREAIEKMKCKEKNCKYLDENGIYTFCRAVFTENSCLRNKEKNE